MCLILEFVAYEIWDNQWFMIFRYTNSMNFNRHAIDWEEKKCWNQYIIIIIYQRRCGRRTFHWPFDRHRSIKTKINSCDAMQIIKYSPRCRNLFCFAKYAVIVIYQRKSGESKQKKTAREIDQSMRVGPHHPTAINSDQSPLCFALRFFFVSLLKWETKHNPHSIGTTNFDVCLHVCNFNVNSLRLPTTAHRSFASTWLSSLHVLRRPTPFFICELWQIDNIDKISFAIIVLFSLHRETYSKVDQLDIDVINRKREMIL